MDTGQAVLKCVIVSFTGFVNEAIVTPIWPQRSKLFDIRGFIYCRNSISIWKRSPLL